MAAITIAGAVSAMLLGCDLVQGLQRATVDTSGTGGSAGAAGAGGNGSGGSSGGTGGAGGPGNCDPAGQSGPVDDACGVFVSATKGEDTNAGSKESPLATIGAALLIAKGRPIYLCAEMFMGPVTLDADGALLGGLDCDGDWKYVGNVKRTTIAAPEGAVPLRITSGKKVGIQDATVVAADATTYGWSSVALIAETGVELAMSRCDLESGKGADGAGGTSFAQSAEDGLPGADGAEACNVSPVAPPGPPEKLCDQIESWGGFGGPGYTVAGGNAGSGIPETIDNSGKGEIVGLCTPGTAGVKGANGDPGVGATGLGTIDATGYKGVMGTSGKPGAPGEGGGGGGGARGGGGAGKCPDAMKTSGASGANGGTGGCGGQGGHAGGPAGSSIGLLSLSAKLVFKNVTITAKNGGIGGAGGEGQFGGAGAKGGVGGKVPAGASLLHPGCDGGTGADGGRGGTAGGGLGGHSIGIAYAGILPSIDGTTIFIGSAGEGGTGDGVNAASKGAKGVANEVQAF